MGSKIQEVPGNCNFHILCRGGLSGFLPPTIIVQIPAAGAASGMLSRLAGLLLCGFLFLFNS